MPTKQQIINFKLRRGRQARIRRNKVGALQGCPQKKGTCVKIMLITPRKPNSAIRKVARVRLSTKKVVFAYIPGEGHNLQKYSIVLIRGGRAQDVPGVYYKIIRGKFDLQPLYDRVRQRSKIGLKKWKNKQNIIAI